MVSGVDKKGRVRRLLMEAIPNIRWHPNGRRSRTEVPQALYVRHLGVAEAGCERQGGRVCLLDLLSHADLPVPEGVVLSREAHREFLKRSGVLEDLQARFGTGEDPGLRALRVRISHRSSPIEGELNRQICEALIGLGAASVAVVSEGLTKRHLKSIPEVKDAIREAWLSPEGLRRQVEAVSRGEEIPTWPVSILAEGVAE